MADKFAYSVIAEGRWYPLYQGLARYPLPREGDELQLDGHVHRGLGVTRVTKLHGEEAATVISRDIRYRGDYKGVEVWRIDVEWMRHLPAVHLHKSLQTFGFMKELSALFRFNGYDLQLGEGPPYAKLLLASGNLDQLSDSISSNGIWHSPSVALVNRKDNSMSYHESHVASPVSIQYDHKSANMTRFLRGGHQFDESVMEWIFRSLDLFLAPRKVLTLQTSGSVLSQSNDYYGELLARIKVDISHLHSLTPRQFEELVAELLARDGFDVHLTNQTRDGGIDIFARKRERFGDIVYGYECKKYRVDRPIDVGIVRSFATSLREAKVGMGVLVATSYFTADALATAENQLIYPQDRKALHEWIVDTPT